MRKRTRTFAQELVAERTGRDPEELIRELYVEKRLSDREIGEALGVDRGTVQLWRDQWGISAKDRPDAQELIA
jgi:hypothetical protein